MPLPKIALPNGLAIYQHSVVHRDDFVIHSVTLRSSGDRPLYKFGLWRFNNTFQIRPISPADDRFDLGFITSSLEANHKAIGKWLDECEKNATDTS